MSDYRHEVIGLGDDASAMLYEACKHTWPNRAGQYGEPIAGIDHYRGERSWSGEPLADLDMRAVRWTQETDGIGTKVKVARRTKDYSGMAFDMTAMAADDAAAKGYEPALMTTDLNVNRFTPKNTPYMRQLGEGIIAACNRARIALYGGETAILGNLVGGEGDPVEDLWFVWAGAVNAIAHKDRIIGGQEIRPGMSLVGFREFGFRSNGLTAVQNILDDRSVDDWVTSEIRTEDGTTTVGKAVLLPSIIYTPALVDCTGGFNGNPQAHIAGAAHITGGGIWSKLGDLLEVTGYGAEIESPWQSPHIINHVQRLGEVSDYDAYASWNMGNGMIIATSEPEKVIAVAKNNDIEAQEIGSVSKQPGIRLRSAGYATPGQTLSSEAA